MHLYAIPLIFVLIGLALYTVLAGADFGAGMWALLAGSGRAGQRIREHTHNSMAPVWEANHVWLIFVLTVTWTAYPTAFGSIASTLSIPLFIAAIGIVMRGASYALRAGASSPRETRLIDTSFSLSSILTPFALGAAVGAIAARRVPVGNAAGGLLSSWTSPISILIGVLAVASAAYLAAVYLAADAARQGDATLESQFRARALAAGLLAGAIAAAGLFVLHDDARPLYEGLLEGDGRPALVLSALAGVAALALVWSSRFELARYTAALAVAAIVAGWALAQQPVLLPGLTVTQAAAPHDTLVTVIVAVIVGGAILFPSLALLFRLVLGGQLDHAPSHQASAPTPTAGVVLAASREGLLGRLAAAALVAGFGFLTVADAGWAHGIGVLCLLGFVILGFLAVAPASLAIEADPQDRSPGTRP
ncbi:MAG TPA: cytochrome d ubiquinol oxidase subunit II [Solirubrobacteraceae bacterium]|jgi:cytochrome d ubiquinol oxidase subunit II